MSDRIAQVLNQQAPRAMIGEHEFLCLTHGNAARYGEISALQKIARHIEYVRPRVGAQGALESLSVFVTTLVPMIEQTENHTPLDTRVIHDYDQGTFSALEWLRGQLEEAARGGQTNALMGVLYAHAHERIAGLLAQEPRLPLTLDEALPQQAASGTARELTFGLIDADQMPVIRLAPPKRFRPAIAAPGGRA